MNAETDASVRTKALAILSNSHAKSIYEESAISLQAHIATNFYLESIE